MSKTTQLGGREEGLNPIGTPHKLCCFSDSAKKSKSKSSVPSRRKRAGQAGAHPPPAYTAKMPKLVTRAPTNQNSGGMGGVELVNSQLTR